LCTNWLWSSSEIHDSSDTANTTLVTGDNVSEGRAFHVILSLSALRVCVPRPDGTDLSDLRVETKVLGKNTLMFQLVHQKSNVIYLG
jgi:hypothetical protein